MHATALMHQQLRPAEETAVLTCVRQFHHMHCAGSADA